jgi:hypothetical protein
MYVNTAPGLPAASALLILPASALLLASIGAAAAGPSSGAAVAEAGLLRVIWCFSGAAGCGVVGLFSGVGLASRIMAAVWGTPAGLLLIAGLWLRSSHLGDGQTVAERARAAQGRLRREYGKRHALRAEARGVYRGLSPRNYWRRVIGAGLMLPLSCIVAVAVLGGGREPSLLRNPIFYLVACGAGLLATFVVWLPIRGWAREVTWDEGGVRVSWYRGESKRFAWDDVVTLYEVPATRRQPATAVATAASGETFWVVSGYEGYEQIVPALKAHIWATQGD